MSLRTTMEHPPGCTPRQLIFAILAFAALGNFVVMLVASMGMQGMVIATLLVGAGFTQITLHAIWITLLPGPLWHRVLTGTAMGCICYLAWLVGFLAFRQGMEQLDEIAYFPLVGCPVISLAAQTPFWLMRLCFSWRILHHGDQTQERPLAIRDIMAATGAIAFVLASVRYATPPIVSWTSIPFIVALTALAANVLITMPMLIGILKMKDGVLGCLVAVTILAVIGLVLFIVVGAITLAPGQVAAMYFAFLGGLIGSQAIVFHTVRKLGYTLVTPHAKPLIEGPEDRIGDSDRD